MNYKRIYDSLIEKRHNIPVDKNKYYEIHHIIPKSLGGSNCKTNLIALYANEHYIAHLLLWKHFKQTHNKVGEIKMLSALIRLITGNFEFKTNVKPTKFSSKLYTHIRNQFSINQSIRAKNSRFFHNDKGEIKSIQLEDINKLDSSWKPGTGLSSKGLTGYISIVNVNTFESMYIKSNADIPVGWVRGRSQYHKNNTKWYNNGQINIKLKDGETIPNGFQRGRILNAKFKQRSDGITSGTKGLHLIQNIKTGQSKYVKEEIIKQYVYDGSNWVIGYFEKRQFSNTAKNNISIGCIKRDHPEIKSFDNFDFNYYRSLSKRNRKKSILLFKETGNCYLN